MTTISTKQSAKIRHSARQIILRNDLPQARGFARYVWVDSQGDEHSATLNKRNRQVLDAISAGPLFCASPVRVSHSVMCLRRDFGLPIEIEVFTESDGDEKLTFGVYYLAAPVCMEGAV
jgi:hypothetical protein